MSRGTIDIEKLRVALRRMRELHEQRVEVKGRLFPQESVIDVQEYKAP